MAAACVALAACNKEEAAFVEPGEIILSIDDGSIEMTNTTKATAITAVSGLTSVNVVRTTGTWKSETNKDSKTGVSAASGSIATGWYQTASGTAYNYYVSNSAITFGAGGSTIAASNATDVVAGCTQAANNTTSPSVTLEHVFARTGTLTATAPSGYTASGVSWKIVSKSGGTGGTAGTYNIATKAWSGVTALSTATAITGTSDMYLTPGVYTISVTYTLTKGDYSKTSTKSGDVTLVAGKKNNISCTLPVDGPGAQGITLGVTLTNWADQAVTLTLS